MSSSFFFLQAPKNDKNADFLNKLEAYVNEKKLQAYVINKPLGDNKYKYRYDDAIVLLAPKHKILFINFSPDNDDYKDFKEDFLEDLGSISDKFKYKDTIGRPRQWRDELIASIDSFKAGMTIDSIFNDHKINDSLLQKKCELLISLLTGSINDIDRVKGDVPETLLDRVKQKILLFDGEQTRFIYKSNTNRKVTIQGLSGTGKTELLLHKLKELYIGDDNQNRIMFTCHNKILSANLKNRIPDFFNFMKVEEQIKWNERLWCEHAWGSQSDKDSGAYRYICHYYGIPFNRFNSMSMDFKKACEIAIKNIKELKTDKYAFDYILIDESQDFPDSFFELCKLVTSKTVFIAGDIFQSIFASEIVSEIDPDYLLSQCYRTDPRTLMFAHALGMGLFENPKLRWLEDIEWKACGYLFTKHKIENNIDKYTLTREPLRRFEDIDPKTTPSMKIVKVNNEIGNAEKKIVDIITNIREKNPTVQAQDIGLIFFSSDKGNYTLADRLEVSIPKHFGWEVNKAYESKEKIDGSLFISNQNNVKGLEFPFVICIAENIRNSYHFRNSLYMMLTRSFLQTYLVVSEQYNKEIIPQIEHGLSVINDTGSMVIEAPTEKEKERIKTTINIGEESKNFYDFVDEIFEDMGVGPLFRKPLYEVVCKLAEETFDTEIIKSIITANYSFVKKRSKK
ncbi:DEAD/DEAH box helicase [Yersinia bercovieri]|uniref:DEAD/DEAH box helicase n=1 Tax=Yersinia bercovieri TaxID=634 RepID=UPI003FD8F428